MSGCDEKSLPWIIMAVVIVATIAVLWYACNAVKSSNERFVLGKEGLMVNGGRNEALILGKERFVLGKEGLMVNGGRNEMFVLGKERLTDRQTIGREGYWDAPSAKGIAREGMAYGYERLTVKPPPHGYEHLSPKHSPYGQERLLDPARFPGERFVLGKEYLTDRQAAGREYMVPQYVSNEGLNPGGGRRFPGESFVLGKEYMTGAPVKDVAGGDLQAMLY